MKIAQLKTLIKRGESERLEFKTSTASLSSGMQTVCAFLNSNLGGTVIFGVKDDGKIVGQAVSDKTRKEIAVELKKIDPLVKVNVIYVRISEGLYAIVMQVEPGEKAPYTYDGRAYSRNQSTTERMTKEEYMYLLNQNNPTLWENQTSNTCKLIDLDKKRIKEIVRMSIYEGRLPETSASATIPHILKKLKLVVDDKLTNAAVILFCKNEDKQFMQSNIQMARFKGTDKSEFFDTKLARGNAFDLYDKAMESLIFNLPVAARIEPGNPIRVEEPAIPYKVIREALTNALVHRDYSQAGASISIALYNDRVNISNIGSLPKGVSINQLSKEHPSIQRNPVIAHVFYLCGKIEKWGRGTLDMIQACKQAGNPAPIYEEVGGSFSVTFPLKEPMHTIAYEKQKTINFVKLTSRQKEIVNILKKGPLNRQGLMDRLDITITDRGMQKELAKLNKLGLIKAMGKGKALVWFIVD
jgi:ATP-dependent DNA helicase RecG